MRSCLCRWTSQLRQSRERPGCSTLRRTFCGRSLAGVRRGGPGCSSQLPGAGRLGLPGPIPSHRCLGAAGTSSPHHHHHHPHLRRSASLRKEPFSSPWPVTWLFDHRENTLISDSRSRFPSLPKISRKTGKQSSTCPIFQNQIPISLLYRYLAPSSQNPFISSPTFCGLCLSLLFFFPPLFPLLSPPSHVPDSPYSGKLRSLPSLPLPKQVSDSTGAAGPPPAAGLNLCPPTVRSSSAHLSIKAKCKLPAERRGSEPFLGPLRGSPNPCLPDLRSSR